MHDCYLAFYNNNIYISRAYYREEDSNSARPFWMQLNPSDPCTGGHFPSCLKPGTLLANTDCPETTKRVKTVTVCQSNHRIGIYVYYTQTSLYFQSFKLIIGFYYSYVGFFYFRMFWIVKLHIWYC